MSERDWTRVTDMADIEPGKPYSFNVGGTDVLVYIKEDESVLAVADECPHYGAPLSDGSITDSTVTCPWHNARFDIQSGELLGPPALDCLRTFATRIDSGALYLRPEEPPQIAMPEGSDSRRIVIVGGGAAGNACAETLRREGFAGQITMLSADHERPYDRPMLSKGFVSGMAEESWLPLRSQEFYDRLQVDLLTDRWVNRVDVESREIFCDNGDTYTADRIVLATGSRPRRLNIPGWDLEGVYTLRTASDARAIREKTDEDATVVIVGAGFIGMELASDLRQRGLTVHVVAPEDYPMSLMFGNEIGKVVKSIHESNGVEFHMGTKPKEILGEDRCRNVRLFDDSTLSADFVVAGLGVEPVVQYLGETDLVSNGAIEVDERMATSADGVFAAGDIASVPYPHREKRYRIEHWVVAEAQGMHAAGAILGSTEAYAKVPFFWTRQYETSIKYIGYLEANVRSVVRGSVEDRDGLVGYFDGDRLIGAASLGRSTELLAVERLLASGEPVSSEDFEKGEL